MLGRRFAKGYVLSGKLPWVSNLVDRRFVVAVAARTLAAQEKVLESGSCCSWSPAYVQGGPLAVLFLSFWP